ncbi:hypothetical protein D6D22_08912 [Aureobasidium pullulans]|uniref:Uncharacterized protein n=1 Tax=Aureobasidium pullulans TaxID=5580 RepID=A0A4S8X8N8_AURPU|nr:hypothetical protein D6D22_08912 [Aureobasidium pullulans]
MGATNTMALYTTALLGYISFLPSSPVITLATPSLASQEDNSDLDDIIPDLVNISSASSKDTFRPSVGSFFAKGQPREPALHQLQRHDFFITYIKEFTPRCSLFPAVSSFPNSPNNLFTLSDLKHRNLGYIQADSTI